MELTCTNGSSKAMLLVVEPWAEEYWLDPGVSVEVVGDGGVTDGGFDVEYVDTGILIYARAGSVVSVFMDGELVSPKWQVSQ